jgi:hypothetical protein
MLEIKGRTFPGHVSSPSLSPNYTRWTNAADEWAWSPLVVSGVPGDRGVEQPTTLGTLHMIPDVGHEWSLPRAASISPMV